VECLESVDRAGEKGEKRVPVCDILNTHPGVGWYVLVSTNEKNDVFVPFKCPRQGHAARRLPTNQARLKTGRRKDRKKRGAGGSRNANKDPCARKSTPKTGRAPSVFLRVRFVGKKKKKKKKEKTETAEKKRKSELDTA